MADVTVVTPGPSDEGLGVAFARLEGKVDVVLTRHDVRLESLERADRDKEDRLRAIEGRPTVPPVVDARLRALEDRRTVSPRDLLLTSGSVVALGVGLMSLINWLRPVIAP